MTKGQHSPDTISRYIKHANIFIEPRMDSLRLALKLLTEMPGQDRAQLKRAVRLSLAGDPERGRLVVTKHIRSEQMELVKQYLRDDNQ